MCVGCEAPRWLGTPSLSGQRIQRHKSGPEGPTISDEREGDVWDDERERERER